MPFSHCVRQSYLKSKFFDLLPVLKIFSLIHFCISDRFAQTLLPPNFPINLRKSWQRCLQQIFYGKLTNLLSSIPTMVYVKVRNLIKNENPVAGLDHQWQCGIWGALRQSLNEITKECLERCQNFDMIWHHCQSRTWQWRLES